MAPETGANQMNFDNTPAGLAGNDVRQPYQSPRLSLFGDVGSLTETGSMVSMEDFFQNNMCVFANMTGNMC
jgi:hypothetical protein